MKKICIYACNLNDGRIVEVKIDNGIGYNDKDGSQLLITSAVLIRQYEEEVTPTHEEVIAELAEGLTADAIAQLDEVK